MRVKVGNQWFDCKDVPLAVQFTRDELDYVKNEMRLDGGNRKFASVNTDDSDSVLAWLRDEVDL